MRAGGNLAPVAFESTEDFGSGVHPERRPTIAALTSPIATFQPQGRDTRTYQFIDTATYVTGNHTLQFGGSFQQIRVNPYNFAGRFPTVTFGFSAAAPAGGAAHGGAVPRRHQRRRPGAPPTRTWPTCRASISQVAQTFQVREPDVGLRRPASRTTAT